MRDLVIRSPFIDSLWYEMSSEGVFSLYLIQKIAVCYDMFSIFKNFF